jgi:hypothetical protein
MLTGPPPKFHETWDILAVRAGDAYRSSALGSGKPSLV